MKPPPLTDQAGRPFALDRQLFEGGEGWVFTSPNDPHVLAKVLKSPSPEDGEKLAALLALANPQLRAVTAWPGGLLLHARTRQVVGFVMPRLTDCQPIHHLYHPVQRLKYFPRAGWAFQLRAAQNLAAAFDEVHKTGCVVGDVNESNALVTSQALVRLIDCNSFQVRANGKQFLCDVGKPQYIPPELQGKHLRGQARTENHDRFGLAVLIYQLLFVGKHPYMGVYQGRGDPLFEDLIREFRFAQGPMARSWEMTPPPHSPTFADIPPDVGMLFRRAFERGSELGNRPRPGDWLAALRQLEQQTVECAADPGHKYWRGANGCVWCRLAANGGPEYYYGIASDSGTFAVDEAKLQDVLRRIATAGSTEFRYDRDRFAPPVPPDPVPLPEGLDEHRATAQVLSVATGLCVLAMPLGVIRGFICVIAFLAAVTFGVWLAVLVSQSPLRREIWLRRRARRRAGGDLEALEHEWEQHVQVYRRNHSALGRRIHSLVDACRGLNPQYQAEIRQLTAHAEGQARLRHLRLHLIADADIPNIGTARKQILAAHTIFSAANVEWHTIRGIKGFGDALTGNLVEWRQEVERKFRFDPTTAVSPAEQKAVVVHFRTQQQTILADLDRLLAEAESLEPACRAALQLLVPDLQAAVAEWEQAVADMSLVRGRTW